MNKKNALLKIFLCCFFLQSFCLLNGQENNAILCADGIDNDGDGNIDCEDTECINLTNQGCQRCTDGLSFVDVVLEYVSGCDAVDEIPSGILGVSDFIDQLGDEPEFVFLGEGGWIKLGFLNNLMVNSGDTEVDFLVFETGPALEPTAIKLHPADAFTETQLINAGLENTNGDSYYYFDIVPGGTAGLDIDSYVPGFASETLKFDAIELIDAGDLGCLSPPSGADIDAVCALYYIEVDCSGSQGSTSIFDQCGECLDPNDPAFNQSCADCNGIPNGPAILDDCGECLLASSSLFNQSCTDCAGEIFGPKILDECGICLEPDDPTFNQSCIDCNNIPNGPFIIDDCGDCNDPNGNSFNQACADCNGTPAGNAIIDDCGNCNIPNTPGFNQACTDCNGLLFGTAEIDECGVCLEPDDPVFDIACNPDKLIYIPNAFSPNDDNINDQFSLYPKTSVVEKVNEVLIFDRLGENIYARKNLENETQIEVWDGTFKGKDMPSGIYVYAISVQSITGTVFNFSGDIMLFR